MQVVYFNGTRLHLTWREMQNQFRHPLFVGPFLALCGLIVLIGPYDSLLNFVALRLAIFYAIAFSSFIGMLYLALYVCHRRSWPAYSVLTVGFAGVGSSFAGLFAALLLGAPTPSFQDMALVVGFNLVFSYLGEILHATFVMPRILADLRAGQVPVNTAGPPAMPAIPDPPRIGGESAAPGQVGMPLRVTLFGQSFAAEQLRLVEAEEHYVGITLRTGDHVLLRGRIADAVASIPPHLGKRVHRSYWVANAAIDGFRQEKNGAQLILKGGRVVPVARQRIAEVRQWADRVIGPNETKKAPRRMPLVES